MNKRERVIQKKERKERRLRKRNSKDSRWNLSEEEKKVKKRKKENRCCEFLLNHHSSKFVSDKSKKLRCQITGCREGAVTLLGKKKVCQTCFKKHSKGRYK